MNLYNSGSNNFFLLILITYIPIFKKNNDKINKFYLFIFIKKKYKFNLK